jgi:hypothetical protein
MPQRLRVAGLLLALLLPFRAEAICSNAPLFWKLATAAAGAMGGVIVAVEAAGSPSAKTGNIFTDIAVDAGELLGAVALGGAIGGTGGYFLGDAVLHGPGENGCGAPQDPVGRYKHNRGFYVTAMGDPYPSLMGVNFAYSADFVRVHVGVGYIAAGFPPTVSSLSSSSVGPINGGAGASVFVPEWRLTPIAGIHVGSLPTPSSQADSSQGSSSSSAGNIPYVNVGLDWQNQNLNAGAGINVPLSATLNGASVSLSGVAFALFPYAYLGYYF